MSAARLNIDGSSDPSYRYKMDALETHQRGRGNGSWTSLTNLDKVAMDLKIDVDFLFKFFSFFLDTATKITDKTLELNGHHEKADLQAALQVFIRRFILCSGEPHGCGKPELTMILEGKDIICDCRACGKRRRIEDNKKKSEKDNAKMLKMLSYFHKPMNKSKFATHDGMREAATESDDAVLQDPVTRLREVLDLGAKPVLSEMRAMRQDGSLKKRDRLPLVVAAVFNADLLAPKETMEDEDGDTVECNALQKHADLLDLLLESTEMQFVLLRSFELLIMKFREDLLNPRSVCGILGILHEEGLVDEDAIIEWSKSNSPMVPRAFHAEVVNHADQFVQFLEESDSEDDESGDEESGSESGSDW
ncbi:Domain found in IF2B/IF5 [Carpediemonas membranifera]|uniref:Domain found in IF2B/IF5 n=1 Tax=Carpediemonas membranifera TaxID=201153 RepID=A0A8J6B3S5_9EUKA|nr:Domain found in IF2B/IF5 [Carpediemonas membranifera]|eukprot:KAG9395103.1 Domain found in IF2B/IF5 [Carpediemonas membranifera]